MSTQFLKTDGYYYVRGSMGEKDLAIKLKQILGDCVAGSRDDEENVWEVQINEALLRSANFRPGSNGAKLRDLFQEKSKGLKLSMGAEIYPTPIRLQLD